MRPRHLITPVLATALLAGCAVPSGDPGETSLVIAGNTVLDHDTDWYGQPAVQAVYDALVSWDETTYTFGPFLAEGYEISDDKSTLTMTLRDDVVFSDGESLTAEGVATVLAEHPFLAGYTPDFEALDEHTLLIRPTIPVDPQMFQFIAGVPIPSAGAYGDLDALATSPVGSGPYLLDEENSTVGVELHYVRNPDYWGDAEDYPYDTLTVKTFDDSVAAFNALKSGQVDAAPIDIGSAQNAEESGFEVTAGVGTFWSLVFGERSGDSPVADVRVRRAINMAFDREGIDEAQNFGFGGVSAQVFTASQPWYLEGRDGEYPFDPEGARALLAEAGYPDGFALEIPSYADLAPVEPVVQQSLADIGITVTYEPLADGADWFEKMRDYPVALMQVYYINTYNFHIKPNGGVNPWGTEETRALDLIETIDTGSDADALAAGRELAALVLEDAWFAPFSRVPRVWAAIPEVDVTLLPVTAGIRLTGLRPAG